MYLMNYINNLIRKPNAASFATVAIIAVTGVGAPWYASGTHM